MRPKAHVYVALSGGVDSSIAAKKLLEQGYCVTGIHMETWMAPKSQQLSHGYPGSSILANQIAESLGVPFISLDLREKFYSDIVQPFIQQYLIGRTPNPCLFCNPQIKWGVLQAYAFTHGGDYFATGHYARIQVQDSGAVKVLRGVDKTKDQSYVLCMLSQSQLKRTLLPLGVMNKEQVRNEAQKLKLPLDVREESQDLCFLGSLDYRKFLQHFAPETNNSGKIVDLGGHVLGEHQGLAFFTIGQRKGIRIAAPEPYYVVGKDPEKNLLIVGFKDQVGKTELEADQVNWIKGIPPKTGESYQVMVRYRAKPISAVLSSVTDDGFRIKFKEQIHDISQGQVAVLYQEEECLGGGVIRTSG